MKRRNFFLKKIGKTTPEQFDMCFVEQLFDLFKLDFFKNGF